METKTQERVTLGDAAATAQRIDWLLDEANSVTLDGSERSDVILSRCSTPHAVTSASFGL